MMPDRIESPPDEAESAAFPAAGLRTAISFLLFAHLFMLAAGVWGNFGARTGRDIKDKLVQTPLIHDYLTMLDMDTSYDYALVTGMSDDWDHQILLALNVPQDFGGTPEELSRVKTVNLVPNRLWPGIRRTRYQMLGLQIAEAVAEQDNDSSLPKDLATGMLHELSVSPAVNSEKLTRHRFICRTIQTRDLYRDETAPPEPSSPYDPVWLANVYQADIVPSGDQWDLVKFVPRGEATRSGPSRRSAAPSHKAAAKPIPPQPAGPGGPSGSAGPAVQPKPRPQGPPLVSPLHGDR